ncbi:MAG: hypothetical protein NXH91_19030 [Phyllobacteriaceae bacterium]|jgi:hypothetical protein|nr:hypothetical protein [Phyllobacteriaceae bacterium]
MHKTLIATMTALAILAPAGAFAGSTADDAVRYYSQDIDTRATASIGKASACEAAACERFVDKGRTLYPSAPVTPQFGH